MPHEEAFCLTVRFADKDNTNSIIYNFHCNYIAMTCYRILINDNDLNYDVITLLCTVK